MFGEELESKIENKEEANSKGASFDIDPNEIFQERYFEIANKMDKTINGAKTEGSVKVPHIRLL